MRNYTIERVHAFILFSAKLIFKSLNIDNSVNIGISLNIGNSLSIGIQRHIPWRCRSEEVFRKRDSYLLPSHPPSGPCKPWWLLWWRTPFRLPKREWCSWRPLCWRRGKACVRSSSYSTRPSPCPTMANPPCFSIP